jgi:hypothetical protein
LRWRRRSTDWASALESTLLAQEFIRTGRLVMPVGGLGVTVRAHRLVYRHAPAATMKPSSPSATAFRARWRDRARTFARLHQGHGAGGAI